MNKKKHIRQISLPQVGEDGQQKLYNAKVLIVGAGGLGNVILPYLASSGVGTIGVIDGDVISFSNLHRQILFSEGDIQKSKVEVVCRRLSLQFPDIHIVTYNEFLSSENALPLFKGYDIIVDATDNIEIRYLINDAAVITQKPFVHASVYRFQFQVATFNVHKSGTYRCLYPYPPKNIQNCSEAGVMPSTVAMAGIYQTNEVLKLILGTGDLLINKLLLIDTLTNRQHPFDFKKREENCITEIFFKNEYGVKKMNTIPFKEALEMDGLFLDVRNSDEEPQFSFENYVQIPLRELEYNLSKIMKKKYIYVFCKSGKRSANAYQILSNKQFDKVYCLKENASEINKLVQEVL